MLRGTKLAILSLALMSCFGLSAKSYAQDPDKMVHFEAVCNDVDLIGDADSADKVVPLVTDALRHAGFAIWGEDHKPVSPALGKSIGYAATPGEIKSFSEMYIRGDYVTLGELLDSIEFLSGSKVVKAEVIAKLNNAQDFNADFQPVQSLVQRLNQQSVDSPAFFAADTRINPISAFIIMRMVTEDIRRSVVKAGHVVADSPVPHARLNRLLAIENQDPFQDLFASISPKQAQEQTLPGWAEDATVGTFLNGLEKNLNVSFSKINALSSICKFIATYTFLKGEGTVDNPPLVRTMDTSAGQVRKVHMKFSIDGNAVADWLKENRMLLMASGVDVDMPHTGPLAGIETEWEIAQSRKSTKQNLVRVQQGSYLDISKVKTDANGVATIPLEGNPRQTALNPKAVKPDPKVVMCYVTPQAKATEMGQDLTDAVFGAMGIKEGAAGFIGPVMETLYRMKWKGRTPLKVEVKDWMPADYTLTMTIEVKGHYRFISKSGFEEQTIDRYLDVSGMTMASKTMSAVPTFDESVLERLPAAQREMIKKQMEEAKKQLEEANKDQFFESIGGGQVQWRINDRTTKDADEGECEVARNKLVETFIGSGNYDYEPEKKGDASDGVRLEANLKDMKMTISPLFIWDVMHTIKQTRTGQPPKDTTVKNSMGLLTGLNIQDVGTQNIVKFPFQVQKEEGAEGTGSIYRGSARIPFKRGNAEGTIIVAAILYQKPNKK